MNASHRALIREDCINSLVDTIEAFVELHEINSHCSRSWISLQRSIASAFLLVANDDGAQTWALIDRLERVLADHVYDDGDVEHNSRTDTAKHLSSSLRALREIREAFRVRKGGEMVSTPAQTNSPLKMPSPPSVEPSLEVPVTLAANNNLLFEDWSMRNILGRVSDVMLFPSMSDKPVPGVM
jgi:hypothetical protein